MSMDNKTLKLFAMIWALEFSASFAMASTSDWVDIIVVDMEKIPFNG